MGRRPNGMLRSLSPGFGSRLSTIAALGGKASISGVLPLYTALFSAFVINILPDL